MRADIDRSFDLTERLEGVRLMIGVACSLNIRLFQLGFFGSSTFCDSRDEIYVTQPKGFKNPIFPEYVYKLKQDLCGLKQAPYGWYRKLTEFLTEHGFERGNANKTMFVLKRDMNLLIVQTFDHNIVFGSTRNELAFNFVEMMKRKFEMVMVGEMTYCLGLQIKQTNGGIYISQESAAKNILRKLEVQMNRESQTPMGTDLRMSRSEHEERADAELYEEMMSGLLQLTATRPDISFSVGVCARYLEDPRMSHFHAARRILTYVKGTTSLGLFYSKDTNQSLASFCDSDWAGNRDDGKSISGGCLMMGNNLISWYSKKQRYIARSTGEAQIDAFGNCYTQLVWIKQLLFDYGIVVPSISIFSDKPDCINALKDITHHELDKHIDIRHHVVQELIANKTIKMSYVSSENQIAKLFTKPLNFISFSNFKNSIGMCDH
ncbi:uncharacterized protein LOC111828563 [Capsella rubella]|uniref:uncharacterized protein LOC111828563 n=1 Tax=Capsella rubella TaxID=81985 RepID=UPI000CD566C9|nr:uncharacterized protein LOC111828563 [Capsella rubella]